MTITCERVFVLKGPQGFLCKHIGQPLFDRLHEPLELYKAKPGDPKLWVFYSRAQAKNKKRDLAMPDLRIVVCDVIGK